VSEFLHHYREILTDPAHLAVEITLMLLIDVLLLGMIWPLVRRMIDRRVHREHRVIDAEHGVRHKDGHTPDLGLPFNVIVSRDLPPNVVEFRHADGTLAGRMEVE
jgi:hypothetical protein